MAWISPRTVIKYFSGEDEPFLSFALMEEDPYDPRDSLDESDNEGTQNTKNLFIS